MSWSKSGEKSTFDVGRMISLMVGRDIEQLDPERLSTPSAEVVLAARGLSARGLVENVDLTLHGGEVLGVFGLMGSGRTELARILFGSSASTAVRSRSAPGRLTRTSPRKSIANRVAFITENRREEGLMMSLSIADNIALAALPSFAIAPLKVVDQTLMPMAAREIAAALQIKAEQSTCSPPRAFPAATSRRW